MPHDLAPDGTTSPPFGVNGSRKERLRCHGLDAAVNGVRGATLQLALRWLGATHSQHCSFRAPTRPLQLFGRGPFPRAARIMTNFVIIHVDRKLADFQIVLCAQLVAISCAKLVSKGLCRAFNPFPSDAIVNYSPSGNMPDAGFAATFAFWSVSPTSRIPFGASRSARSAASRSNLDLLRSFRFACAEAPSSRSFYKNTSRFASWAARARALAGGFTLRLRPPPRVAARPAASIFAFLSGSRLWPCPPLARGFRAASRSAFSGSFTLRSLRWLRASPSLLPRASPAAQLRAGLSPRRQALLAPAAFRDPWPSLAFLASASSFWRPWCLPLDRSRNCCRHQIFAFLQSVSRLRHLLPCPSAS